MIFRMVTGTAVNILQRQLQSWESLLFSAVRLPVRRVQMIIMTRHDHHDES